jgi:hypothetical protein
LSSNSLCKQQQQQQVAATNCHLERWLLLWWCQWLVQVRPAERAFTPLIYGAIAVAGVQFVVPALLPTRLSTPSRNVCAAATGI